jgi:hypothetical protein
MSETTDVLARFRRHIRLSARKIDYTYTNKDASPWIHLIDLEEATLEAQVCVCTVAGLMDGIPSFYNKLADWPTQREASANMGNMLNQWLSNWARATVRDDRAAHGDMIEPDSLEWSNGETREVPFSDARLVEVDVADVWRKYPTLAAIIRDGYTEQELADAEGHTQQAINKRYAKELAQARAEWPEGLAG